MMHNLSIYNDYNNNTLVLSNKNYHIIIKELNKYNNIN